MSHTTTASEVEDSPANAVDIEVDASEHSTGSSTGESQGDLKRSLGFWDNLFLAVGSILGAGIYAILGEAAGLAGSMLWVSLAIAAITALLCACCYGELVSRFPDSGGGYEYIAQGFGRTFANGMSVILFLTGIVSPAAIALAFGQYLSRLVAVPVFWSATCVIVLMAGINVVGSKLSSVFNILATIITVLGLVLAVAFCAPHIGERNLAELPKVGWAGVFGGAALAFFSYVGFEDVVKMAEETKKPRINVPWALVTAGIFVMGVYIIVAIAAVSAVDWELLANSDGPLAEVMANTWGPIGGVVIVLVALFATSKCILTNIMSNSRLVYDLSRDTALPKWFGWLIPKFKSPVVAIGLVTVLTWCFALIGDLATVASLSNLLVLSLFLTVCASLAKVRYDGTGNQPAFELPWNVAGISIINIAAIAMLIVMIGFNIYNLL